jgi:hypothetical protein
MIEAFAVFLDALHDAFVLALRDVLSIEVAYKFFYKCEIIYTSLRPKRADHGSAP